MKLNEYQQHSAKFAKDMCDPPIIGWLVGLAGETGEVAELIKKSVLRKGEEPNPVLLAGELGDVLWYLSQIATEAGITLQEIAEQNLEKLEGRHGTPTDSTPATR